MLVLLLTCLLLVAAGSVLSRVLERQTSAMADSLVADGLHARKIAQIAKLNAPGPNAILQQGRLVGEAGGVIWDPVNRSVHFRHIRLDPAFQWGHPFEFRSRPLELDTFDIVPESGNGGVQPIVRLSRVVCHWSGTD
jgi:hypothetical protein